MSHLRILIVDDEPHILKPTTVLLQREGHEIEAATDAEWGLALSRASRFDAILMDVGLPGMSGLQALKKLSAASKAAVFLMTGHADNELAKQALQSGARALLLKPLNMEDLRARLKGLS